MIWVMFGLLSVFWDPGMGYIFPMISLYTFGYFWKRTHPALVFTVLLLHHITSLNSGFMELTLIIIIFLITEIDSLFITPVIPYFILAASATVVFLATYGILAAITAAIAATAIYIWRG